MGKRQRKTLGRNSYVTSKLKDIGHCLVFKLGRRFGGLEFIIHFITIIPN